MRPAPLITQTSSLFTCSDSALFGKPTLIPPTLTELFVGRHTPRPLYHVTPPQGLPPPSPPSAPPLHHANTQMDANVSFGHEKLSGLICALRPEDTADDADVALPPPRHVRVYPVPSSPSVRGSSEGSGSAAGVAELLYGPQTSSDTKQYAKVTPPTLEIT